MTLIDTSSWIEALRQTGKQSVRARVEGLVAKGEAAWCNIVRLELWNGLRGQQEKKGLRVLDRRVHNLEIYEKVWETAISLAQDACSKGLSVPANDLIILACGQRHGVRLEHNDKHLDQLISSS